MLKFHSLIKRFDNYLVVSIIICKFSNTIQLMTITISVYATIKMMQLHNLSLIFYNCNLGKIFCNFTQSFYINAP